VWGFFLGGCHTACSTASVLGNLAHWAMTRWCDVADHYFLYTRGYRSRVDPAGRHIRPTIHVRWGRDDLGKLQFVQYVAY